MSDDQTTARRVTVRGRVQGVFFRDSTQRTARDHGVCGWVRNEPDGTVAALLEGPPAGVDEVLTWMRGGGPPHAHVDEVVVDQVPVEGHDDFVVRH